MGRFVFSFFVDTGSRSDPTTGLNKQNGTTVARRVGTYLPKIKKDKTTTVMTMQRASDGGEGVRKRVQTTNHNKRRVKNERGQGRAARWWPEIPVQVKE